MKLKHLLLIGVICTTLFLMVGCANTIPYLPTSSDVPYGYVKYDQLHRIMIYDKKTGTYIKRKDPEIVQFDHDGIAASYSMWKGRDSEIDDLINEISE